jgi:hypothetical protein
MKKIIVSGMALILCASLVACRKDSEQGKESKKVNQQQSQYAKGQPIPTFNWSLERHLQTELYKARNTKVATHSVWRSNTGMIEDDCPSLGFGLPYDVSLTNPLTASRSYHGTGYGSSVDVVEQPEPNGVFASKNTNATWVFCVNNTGSLDPIYVESKVTSYPYSVNVNYESNRVTKIGESTFTISKE